MRSIIIVAVLLSVAAVVSGNIVTGSYYAGPSCPSTKRTFFTIADTSLDGSQCSAFSAVNYDGTTATGYARVSCQQSSTATTFTSRAWTTLSQCNAATNNHSITPIWFVYNATASFDSSSQSTCINCLGFNATEQLPASVANINCNAQDISGFIAFIEKVPRAGRDDLRINRLLQRRPRRLLVLLTGILSVYVLR